MSTDASMRALVFDGPGRLRLANTPIPRPGEGEVLIRVHSAAICGTDVRIVSGRKTREVRVGHPIGHECAGTVAAAGAGATGYVPGQRIAVCVVVSCGHCEYCDADAENLCETRITLGYHTDGAFAEYMLIPAHAVSRGNLFNLPESIPMEQAPLLEPMACCLNGQHEMGLDGVRSLVIFGAGPIGLTHLMLAFTRRERTRGQQVGRGGCALDRIAVVEPMAHRRELALQFGADAAYAPDEFNATGEFDAAILAVGVPDLVDKAIRAVGKRGKVSLFAGFDVGAAATIDPNAIHYKQVRVTGASESRRRDYAEALSLVASGAVNPSPLITHRFPMEAYDEAFRVAADGSGLKIAFEM